MSLVKCPECGKENVSDKATNCPDCGFPIAEHFSGIGSDPTPQLNPNIYQKQPAKKKNALIVVLVIVFALAIMIGLIAFFIVPNIKRSREIREQNSQQSASSAEATDKSATDNIWSIVNGTDSFGDAIEGQFAMTATFDGTATDIANKTVDVSVGVGIAEWPERNSEYLKNLMKGFLVSFTPVSKETGKPFLYTGTNATVEIKMGNQKYILYGEISGNNIVLNLMADQNKYIPSGAVENNIDTQELLRMIYNSKDDVEFALNGTCRFVLYKGNFNDVFDGADWNNPEPINGKSANGNNDTKEADEKNNKTPEDPTPEPKVKV